MLDKNLLKNLKLIVFDLDGTLLNEQNEVGKESVRLINELKKLGLYFSIATGRLLSAFKSHAELINLKQPLISLDGCYISDLSGKVNLYQSCLKPKHVKKAIKLAEDNLMNIALCHADAIYYTDTNSAIPSITDKFGATFKEVESYDNYLSNTLEILITGDVKEYVKKVKEKFTFPYSIGLNAVYYKAHSHDVFNLEIKKKGSTKGTGLKRLTKYLKVKEHETAVMGDWHNDRSLFETDALKIAVANAVPEIKRMADFITERTNNEDAAAEFLTMVYEAKNKYGK